MPFVLTRRYGFTARHFLPTAPAEHPSSRMHPHDFRVELVVSGDVDPNTGWVIDYGEIDRRFEPLLSQMRDAVLNEIPGLDCPSSENLARFIFDRMKPEIPLLDEVRVGETPDDQAAYRAG
ncbi:MAG: 6-carboxytetrahydropterin synthase [Planctomycetota bacterium]